MFEFLDILTNITHKIREKKHISSFSLCYIGAIMGIFSLFHEYIVSKYLGKQAW